jgi:hypothetical protein
LIERRTRMTEPSATPLRQWRYGLHPRAKGLQIRSLGRVELPLGEALRLEMVDTAPDAEDTAYVQYYIATEAGPWALWVSCARDELADREATLQEITPPLA